MMNRVVRIAQRIERLDFQLERDRGNDKHTAAFREERERRVLEYKLAVHRARSDVQRLTDALKEKVMSAERKAKLAAELEEALAQVEFASQHPF